MTTVPVVALPIVRSQDVTLTGRSRYVEGNSICPVEPRLTVMGTVITGRSRTGAETTETGALLLCLRDIFWTAELFSMIDEFDEDD